MTPERTPLLPELCASIAPIPAGVETATALIAAVPPKTLRRSTAATMLEAFSAELDSDDRMARAAESLLERTIQNPDSRPARRQARELLEKALADQQAAAAMYQELLPALMLAREVDTKQFRLSKPLRWAVSLSLAALLGSGVAYETYEGAHSSNHDAIAMTIQDNKKYPEYKLPIPKESLTTGQKTITGMIGAVGAFMGGMGGVYLSIGFSDRYARRRARRIVSKAQKV